MPRARRLANFGPMWTKLANTIGTHDFAEPIRLNFADRKSRDHFSFEFYAFRKSAEGHIRKRENKGDSLVKGWVSSMEKIKLKKIDLEDTFIVEVHHVDVEGMNDHSMDIMDQLDNLPKVVGATRIRGNTGLQTIWDFDYKGSNYKLSFDPKDPDNGLLISQFIAKLER